MNPQSVICVAVVAASLALHVDVLVYWIGPAGCIILIPALILVLSLGLWDESARFGRVRLDSGRGEAPQELPVAWPVADPIEPALLPERMLERRPGLPALGVRLRALLGSQPALLPGVRADVLEGAEKIKITERIKPDGVRERSVMIFYRKASH
jgi:hypothetical protein